MSHPLFSLKGRVAVVTGGTSGIGEAIALGLAEAGAAVVAVGRRAELVKKTADTLRSKGARTIEFPCDVTRRPDLEGLRDAVLKEFGQVDVLVNSAGTMLRKPTLDITEAEWDSVMNTNLKGILFPCQVFGRHMIDRKSGSVINIASLSAFVVLHEVTAYGVSKAGVVALTQYLGCEWATRGVRVNAIAPGFFVTPLNRPLFEKDPARLQRIEANTPMGRTGECRELVGVAVYLASDASSFVTAQVIKVDGGFLAAGLVPPRKQGPGVR